jgi:hypothetical protein
MLNREINYEIVEKDKKSSHGNEMSRKPGEGLRIKGDIHTKLKVNN